MRILVVVHGYPPRESGGTELHSRWLAHALAGRGHELQLFARSDGKGTEREFETWDEQDGPLSVTRYVHPCPDDLPTGVPLHVPELVIAYEDLLRRVRPDLVHVQHLAGSSPEIVETTRRLAIPMAATIHDYWYLCPRIQGLRRDLRLCLEPEGGAACAFHCSPLSPWARLVHVASGLAWRMGRSPEDLLPFRALRRIGDALYARGWASSSAARRASLHRHGLLRGALEHMEALLFPSEDARRRHVDWGLDPTRCHVVEHGLPPLAPLERRDPTPRLAIAMTGVLMAHKGAHVLLEALRRLPAGSWRLELHGRRPRPRYAAGLDAMVRRLPPDHVRFCGGYEHAELRNRLARTDVLVIPSIWPETYNIVLREAWMLGLPVIASNTGGLAEAAARGGPVTLVPPNDPAALARALQAFPRKASPLPPLPSSARPPTVEENAAQVESLFESILEGAGERP